MLAIYENKQCSKMISLSEIEGLASVLSYISDGDKNISQNTRSVVKELISKYHNKPRLLVLSYRANRALKDRADREKAIQKLQARLKRSKNPKQLISKYGFQKFITVKGDAELAIDPEKLIEESRWDGVVGIYASNPSFTNEEVIAHYHGLWQVEESFRIQKHDLRIRPVYHWTPRRVKAHIAIAFMAFVCVRHLEYRVKTQSQKLSPKTIKNTLTQYQASIIHDTKTNKSYLLPSKTTPELNEIYRVMGRKPSHSLKEIQCSA